MPLQGNVRDFNTMQLLNLMNLSHRTGTLTIFESVPTGKKDGTGEQEKMEAGQPRARVSFSKGKLVFAELVGRGNPLVTALNKAGKLTNAQAKAIQDRAKNTTDKALAMRLIGAKYVSQGDIVASIKQHMLDVVYDLVTWSDGPFRFDDNDLPTNDHIMIPVDLENVIIEASRKIKEVDELNKHIENLDMGLRFPENPKEKFKGIQLSVEEWKVVSFVDPRNTIRDIAKANNMSDTEIRRIVYGLEQAGLIRIVKPPGAKAGVASGDQAKGARPGGKRPPRKPPVEATVINKLISKLQSL